MKAFSKLVEEIDTTTKTLKKISLLKEYFVSEKISDLDKFYTLELLSGRSSNRILSSTQLKENVSKASGLPLWLIEESYAIAGDLSETISLLLKKTSISNESSLSEWIRYISDLKTFSGEDKNHAVIKAWSKMDSEEIFIFNKLMSGNFRIGVSRKLIVKALSQLYSIKEGVIEHKLSGKIDVQNNRSFKEFIISEDAEYLSNKPYPFYLASQINFEIEKLGETKDWLAEWKWDGIRGQLIYKLGEINLWSRGEELLTSKLVEFQELKNLLPEDCVIDGEIVGFKDRILPFSNLQSRITRKKLTKKYLDETPIAFIAYDLLEFEGIDLREESLKYRREMLEKLINKLHEQSNLIKISQKIVFNTWDELKQIRGISRDNSAEGIMLKKLDSTYKVGRKRGDWWKWKIDPLSIDAVMLYAQRGHGKRANLYTDYTFAVWNEDRTHLLPFAKAYSGLSDQEIVKVNKFVLGNTIDKFGPVRSVKPLLVFEIAFEGIQLSTRHKAGIAVRFPRISKWRTDKKVEDANTINDLNNLLKNFA